MESTVFKKMKVKPGYTAYVLNPPADYPTVGLDFEFKATGDNFDFVHLFVESRQQYEELLDQAKQKCKPGALFWISYPKGSGKIKYDINRDILWDLSIPQGFHPVAQVALDDKWSAVRLVANEPGQEYARPNLKNKDDVL